LRAGKEIWRTYEYILSSQGILSSLLPLSRSSRHSHSPEARSDSPIRNLKTGGAHGTGDELHAVHLLLWCCGFLSLSDAGPHRPLLHAYGGVIVFTRESKNPCPKPTTPRAQHHPNLDPAQALTASKFAADFIVISSQKDDRLASTTVSQLHDLDVQGVRSTQYCSLRPVYWTDNRRTSSSNFKFKNFSIQSPTHAYRL
jgi:hypothetical protein